MKNLSKLSAAVVLTGAFALSASAADTTTPPCAVPGQTETPPCATQLASEDMNTLAATPIDHGEMRMAAVSNETSLTRMAADLLLEFLPLF